MSDPEKKSPEEMAETYGLIKDMVESDQFSLTEKAEILDEAYSVGDIGSMEYDSFFDQASRSPAAVEGPSPMAHEGFEGVPAHPPQGDLFANTVNWDQVVAGTMPVAPPPQMGGMLSFGPPAYTPQKLPDNLYRHEEPTVDSALNFYQRINDPDAYEELYSAQSRGKGESTEAYKKHAEAYWNLAKKFADETGTPAVRMDYVQDAELRGVDRNLLTSGMPSSTGDAIMAGPDEWFLWTAIQQAQGLLPTNPVQEKLEAAGLKLNAAERIEKAKQDHPLLFGGSLLTSALSGAVAGGAVGGPGGAVLGGLSGVALKTLAKRVPKALKRAHFIDKGIREAKRGLPGMAAIEGGIQGMTEAGRAFRGEEFDPARTAMETGGRLAAGAAGDLFGGLGGQFFKSAGEGFRRWLTKSSTVREGLSSMASLESHAMASSPAYKEAALEAYERSIKGKPTPDDPRGKLKDPTLLTSSLALDKSTIDVADAIKAREDGIFAGLDAKNRQKMAQFEADKVLVDPLPLIKHIEKTVAKRTLGHEYPSKEELVGLVRSLEGAGENVLPLVDNKILLDTWRKLHTARAVTHRVWKAGEGARPPKYVSQRSPSDEWLELDVKRKMLTAEDVIEITRDLDYKLNEAMASSKDHIPGQLKGMQEAVRFVRDQLGPEYQRMMEDDALMLTQLGNLKERMGILGLDIRREKGGYYSEKILKPIRSALREPAEGGSMPSPQKQYGTMDEMRKIRLHGSPGPTALSEVEGGLQKTQEALAQEQIAEEIGKGSIGIVPWIARRFGLVSDVGWHHLQLLDPSTAAAAGGVAFAPQGVKATVPVPGQTGTRAERAQKGITKASQAEKDAMMEMMKYMNPPTGRR